VQTRDTDTHPEARTADGGAALGHARHGDDHDDHGDHGDHGGHGDHAEVFRTRFWVTLLLSLPVIATSEMVAMWFGYELPDAAWVTAVAPVLGTVVFVYGGRVFLAGGVQEARDRQPGMMLLISLAIVVAYGASLLTSLGVLDIDVWWELAALIVVMLLGHWQEMRAIGQARSALDELAALLPDEAERVTDDGGTETVPASELVEGDVVLVRPGGSVPADGTIVDGDAELDESMLTGESNPVQRGEGDRVAAGTVALGSSLRVRVDAIGDDTTIAGIQRLVDEAQSSPSRAQRLADRAAAWLFHYATGTAAVTALVWLALGRPGDAVTRTITVLVIACPHALGLAIPLVVSLSTALSAKQGVLVRDRLALERMRQVDTVLFDKTGTLTAGEHEVTDLVAADGDDDRLLALAAAVEADSEHPLARAIVAAARQRDVDVPTASDFASHTGRGVQARVDGHDVAVGGPALLRERGLEFPASLGDATEGWADRGAAVLHVVVDGQVAGAFALEDRVRDVSRTAVDALHARGIRVVMLTGDARNVAEHVAAELGIDEVRAEVLPEDKEAEVRDLQDGGAVVAMVGDGVNDAPALARADVGIAIGAGTDVAIASAGIVLASDDPRGVVSIVRLSERAYAKMRQNLWWAAGYNVVAVPLAAGVAAPFGFVLPPAVGAALMSLSTVIVALNAQLLRRLDLRPEATDASGPDRAATQSP
jgi:P-type Cu2+ transporter